MGSRRLQAAVAAAAALLALAGCGADDAGGESADSAPMPAAEQPAAGEQAEGGAGPEGTQDEGGGTAGEALVDPRAIIYTGSITVRVDDVDDAATAAAELAERYGGFVGGDQRTAYADEPAQGTLELRIPSEEFTAAVNALGELGDEESREVRTEDVTEEVVDLETRIATAEASVDRTRDLLARAESIEDIVSVERELSEREGNLASLQARQRTLDDLTTLSTITVTLLQTDAEPEEDSDDSGFLAGLASGWRGLTSSMGVLLTGLGVLLPWLVVLGGPAAGVIWLRRRRRTLHPASQGPPAAAETDV